MAKIPTSTQTSLWQRLTSHASQRWPQIRRINTRYRAGFAYIDAVVDEETIRLCRLRYGGSAHQWGFAIYRASHDDYEDSYLPTGYPVGTCEEALDTACGPALVIFAAAPALFLAGREGSRVAARIPPSGAALVWTHHDKAALLD